MNPIVSHMNPALPAFYPKKKFPMIRGIYYLYLQGRSVSQASLFLGGCVLGLFVEPIQGGNTFFRNVDELTPGYTALHLTR
jgi:hypothetical protein